MFRHDYPYTDFHELNLDSFLKEWAKFLETYQEVFDRIDTMEDAFNELKNFVTEYFDDLDVQEEINNKLDDMYENGELETLLQRVIDVSQVMTLNPYLSVSMYRGYLDRNQEVNYQSFLQSACTDGTNMYMFFVSPSNIGTVTIRKYAADKTLIASETAPLHHANGCDYYDGKIYVATFDTKSICLVDPTSLQITETHTFDIAFRSVSVDNDGTVYAAAGGTLYTVDLLNDTYTTKCTLQYSNDAYQSGCVRDGWLYDVGHNPACIYRVNVNNGMTSRIYPIDRYVDLYCTGEIESINQNRTTGVFYISTCSYWSFTNYRQGNVFECDFATNSAPVRRYVGGSVLSVGTLYVDQNYQGGLPDGSVDKPFPCLAAALSAYNSPAALEYKTVWINLKSDCPDEIFYARRETINLNGKYNDTIHKIGQIYLTDCVASVTDVIVKKTNCAESSISRAVYANGSLIDFHGIEIQQKASGATAYADYSTVLNECVGTWYGGDLSRDLPVNCYNSNVNFQIALRSYVVYDGANNPNMYFSSHSSLASLTPAQLENMTYASEIILAVTKSGKSARVIFTPGTTQTTVLAFYVGGYVEYHDITQTYTPGTGYTYSVGQSRIITGFTSGGIATHEDTTPVTLSHVTVISRYA